MSVETRNGIIAALIVVPAVIAVRATGWIGNLLVAATCVSLCLAGIATPHSGARRLDGSRNKRLCGGMYAAIAVSIAIVAFLMHAWWWLLPATVLGASAASLWFRAAHQDKRGSGIEVSRGNSGSAPKSRGRLFGRGPVAAALLLVVAGVMIVGAVEMVVKDRNVVAGVITVLLAAFLLVIGLGTRIGRRPGRDD